MLLLEMSITKLVANSENISACNQSMLTYIGLPDSKRLLDTG